MGDLFGFGKVARSQNRLVPMSSDGDSAGQTESPAIVSQASALPEEENDIMKVEPQSKDGSMSRLELNKENIGFSNSWSLKLIVLEISKIIYTRSGLFIEEELTESELEDI